MTLPCSPHLLSLYSSPEIHVFIKQLSIGCVNLRTMIKESMVNKIFLKHTFEITLLEREKINGFLK